MTSLEGALLIGRHSVRFDGLPTENGPPGNEQTAPLLESLVAEFREDVGKVEMAEDGGERGVRESQFRKGPENLGNDGVPSQLQRATAVERGGKQLPSDRQASAKRVGGAQDALNPVRRGLRPGPGAYEEVPTYSRSRLNASPNSEVAHPYAAFPASYPRKDDPTTTAFGSTRGPEHDAVTGVTMCIIGLEITVGARVWN